MPTTKQQPVADTAAEAGIAPANLEEFDLNKFIDGIVQPSKVVAVAQNRALGQQLIEARLALVEAEAAQGDAKAEGRPTSRRAASTEDLEVEAARARVTDLEERAAATYVFVKVEGGLTRAIRKQAQKDAKGGGVEEYNQSAVAHLAQIYTVDPRVHEDAPGRVLTFEQWGDFAEAVGYLQWDAVINAMAEVTAVGVSPDFSQQPSRSPAGAAFFKS